MGWDLDEKPLLVFWETTKACDLACKHCRAEAIPEPLPSELLHEEGLALIDQIVSFGRPYPMRRLRESKGLGGRCGFCSYREICGGSRARAYAASGDVMAEDPSCAFVPEQTSMCSTVEGPEPVKSQGE